MTDWLTVRIGKAPLIVTIPHAGIVIPPELEKRMVSPWLARKDTDWWVEQLYDFASELDATVIATAISRTVIDVSRDPSGRSLYPGRATTALCPVDTFDGEPLYAAGDEPDPAEIGNRIACWFDPYHAAVAHEIERLRASHDHVVIYDAHAIRSKIPRLFAGTLPSLNIGTNEGATCDPALTARIDAIAGTSPFTHVINGRFKGGWSSRHYGRPTEGMHAIQMELACSSYLDEPAQPGESNWPPPYSANHAAPLRAVLQQILGAAIKFASTPQGPSEAHV